MNFGTSHYVILLHGAEVNISIELGAEVNIWYRSQQLVAEVTSMPKLLVPNIDRAINIVYGWNPYRGAATKKLHNPPAKHIHVLI